MEVTIFSNLNMGIAFLHVHFIIFIEASYRIQSVLKTVRITLGVNIRRWRYWSHSGSWLPYNHSQPLKHTLKNIHVFPGVQSNRSEMKIRLTAFSFLTPNALLIKTAKLYSSKYKRYDPKPPFLVEGTMYPHLW